MKKINKYITIVRSSNTRLSSLSLVSSDAIVELLSNYYDKVDVTEVNTPTDLEKIIIAQPDLVFLGMKFVPLDARLGINCLLYTSYTDA